MNHPLPTGGGGAATHKAAVAPARQEGAKGAKNKRGHGTKKRMANKVNGR